MLSLGATARLTEALPSPQQLSDQLVQQPDHTFLLTAELGLARVLLRSLLLHSSHECKTQISCSSVNVAELNLLTEQTHNVIHMNISVHILYIIHMYLRVQH